MKVVYAILTVILFVVAVVTSVSLGLTKWHIDQDINGWKDRAQVSSEPSDMMLYMSNVKSGMEKWGLTTGNAALIFDTPDKDMVLIMRTVQQHIDQAGVLTKMDRSSPEYQTGLDNLRGSIRELDLHAWDAWYYHDGFGTAILCIIMWILFVVFAFLWADAW